LIVCASSAQKRSEFKGRIIAQTADSLEVNVLNLTKEKGVVTDYKGYFSISVTLGDELYFSALPFEPLKLYITEEVLREQPYQVFLFDKVNTLQEVLLSDSGLIGVDYVDIQTIPVLPFITAATLGLPQATKPLPTVEERRIYTASSGPVDIIVNTINGKLKKLKKLDRWAKLDKLVVQGEQAMAVYYFEEYCGVPEAYITDFVFFCAKDERFKRLLSIDDQLQLFEFFEEKGKAYREFREWE